LKTKNKTSQPESVDKIKELSSQSDKKRGLKKATSYSRIKNTKLKGGKGHNNAKEKTKAQTQGQNGKQTEVSLCKNRGRQEPVSCPALI